MAISRRILITGSLLSSLLVPRISASQVVGVGTPARPSTQEAQALLQARPELVAQLRQRMVTSNMTPEQVRARLRAEGYPENLLDAYLPGATGTPTAPSNEVFAAVRALGLTDSTDIAQLRLLAGADSADTLGGTPRGDGVRPKNWAGADTLFGLSTFRGSTSEFQPNLDGPVDANYRLGPGDRLVLILTGDVELSYTLDVTREGFVVIPQVGQIFVANLTLSQLEDVLYSRLGRVYSGVNRSATASTRFTVSPSRIRSNQVFVVGDVMRPGSYRVSGAGTVMTALYAAGGPTDNGTLRDVVVKRGGKTVGKLDVYDYLLRGDASKDIRLESGDVVFIGVHGPRVRITGQVVRPYAYEIRPGETLNDLIQAAGGFSARASRQRVQIERILPPARRGASGQDRTLLDFSADGDVALSERLEDGDRVRVFPIAERVRNRIRVVGNVWRAGDQAFEPGLTLSQALRRSGGLKPDTYLGQVLVSRLRGDSTRVSLRAMLRDTTAAVVGPDLPLADDDVVTVFSLTEFRPKQFVVVNGAVHQSGQLPFSEGMTLRDALLRAGGTAEGADLREVEVARLPKDRTGGTLATTTRVRIDSSYAFSSVSRSPTTAEFVLEPGDNILVLRQEDWSPIRLVWITGQVRFPGQYAIRGRDERVSDLIVRAGGLTKSANPDASYFLRMDVSTTYQRAALRARSESMSRVGLDLRRVIADPSVTDNLLLEAGDSLEIPAQRTTVEVRGQVNTQAVMPLVNGAALEFYIRAAGGGNLVADLSRAYVVQPNGKIESRHRILGLFTSDPTPHSGATVYVPMRDTTLASSTKLVQTVSIVGQLAATLLTAFAIIRR